VAAVPAAAAAKISWLPIALQSCGCTWGFLYLKASHFYKAQSSVFWQLVWAFLAINPKVIALAETKAVGRLKLVVFLVLVVSAAAVASTVSWFIRHYEHKRFKDEFMDDAGKVLQAVGITIDKTLRSFDSVATTFTTIAEVTNQTWPFVTIPNFAEQMVAVLDLSNAIHVDFIPVVAPHLRKQWEDYLSMNDGWINEALEIQERYTAEYSGPIIYNATYEKRIHDDDGKILEPMKYVFL
jgi:hypothetical protein